MNDNNYTSESDESNVHLVAVVTIVIWPVSANDVCVHVSLMTCILKFLYIFDLYLWPCILNGWIM